MKSNLKGYQELENHIGSDEYEVSVIIPEKNEASYMHFDTINNMIIVDSYYNALNKKDRTYSSLKINSIGEIIDQYEINGILRDGTMKGFDYYSDWIINGDTTTHKYIDPFSGQKIENPYDYVWSEKKFDKWFEVFKKLYDEASYVHIDISFYYFKIGDKWYLLDETLEDSPEDFMKQFPVKSSNDRMMELRDLCPDFFKARAKRDTSFVDIVGYEETDSEKGSGLNPISYSAGDYYLNLYMPLGDTIKIKRHGSMGVNMQFYKIPVTQGGRNDVVFIVQEPNELYPNREFGGMYAVRPRDMDQKEYGPHESSADSYASQYDSIKGGIDTEAKFLKPMDN